LLYCVEKMSYNNISLYLYGYAFFFLMVLYYMGILISIPEHELKKLKENIFALNIVFFIFLKNRLCKFQYFILYLVLRDTSN
jgi:hypothetical protein